MKLKLVEASLMENADSYVDEVVLDFEQSDRSVEEFTSALNTISRKEYDGEVSKDKYDEAIKKLQELYVNKQKTVTESSDDYDEDYEDDYEPEYDPYDDPDIDGKIEEQMMKDRDELIKRTKWKQLIDTPEHKRWVAEDNEHFFRDEFYNPDGSWKSSSSGYEYTKENEESDATQPEDIAKKEEYRKMIKPDFKVGSKM